MILSISILNIEVNWKGNENIAVKLPETHNTIERNREHIYQGFKE